MNRPDDATWLPEGAFVVLGACDAQDCDRVGYALPMYQDVVLHDPQGRVYRGGEPFPGMLCEVRTWCPEHGDTCVTNLAQAWVDYTVARFAAKGMVVRPEAALQIRQMIGQRSEPIGFEHLPDDSDIRYVHPRFTLSISQPK